MFYFSLVQAERADEIDSLISRPPDVESLNYFRVFSHLFGARTGTGTGTGTRTSVAFTFRIQKADHFTFLGMAPSSSMSECWVLDAFGRCIDGDSGPPSNNNHFLVLRPD